MDAAAMYTFNRYTDCTPMTTDPKIVRMIDVTLKNSMLEDMTGTVAKLCELISKSMFEGSVAGPLPCDK
jgi:hypothetical protein